MSLLSCLVSFNPGQISNILVQALPCLAGTDLVVHCETLHGESLTTLKVDFVPGIKANVDIRDVSRVPAELACNHLVIVVVVFGGLNCNESPKRTIQIFLDTL